MAPRKDGGTRCSPHGHGEERVQHAKAEELRGRRHVGLQHLGQRLRQGRIWPRAATAPLAGPRAPQEAQAEKVGAAATDHACLRSAYRVVRVARQPTRNVSTRWSPCRSRAPTSDCQRLEERDPLRRGLPHDEGQRQCGRPARRVTGRAHANAATTSTTTRTRARPLVEAVDSIIMATAETRAPLRRCRAASGCRDRAEPVARTTDPRARRRSSARARPGEPVETIHAPASWRQAVIERDEQQEGRPRGAADRQALPSDDVSEDPGLADDLRRGPTLPWGMIVAGIALVGTIGAVVFVLMRPGPKATPTTTMPTLPESPASPPPSEPPISLPRPRRQRHLRARRRPRPVVHRQLGAWLAARGLVPRPSPCRSRTSARAASPPSSCPFLTPTVRFQVVEKQESFRRRSEEPRGLRRLCPTAWPRSMRPSAPASTRSSRRSSRPPTPTWVIRAPISPRPSLARWKWYGRPGLRHGGRPSPRARRSWMYVDPKLEGPVPGPEAPSPHGPARRRAPHPESRRDRAGARPAPSLVAQGRPSDRRAWRGWRMPAQRATMTRTLVATPASRGYRGRQAEELRLRGRGPGATEPRAHAEDRALSPPWRGRPAHAHASPPSPFGCRLYSVRRGPGVAHRRRASPRGGWPGDRGGADRHHPLEEKRFVDLGPHGVGGHAGIGATASRTRARGLRHWVRIPRYRHAVRGRARDLVLEGRPWGRCRWLVPVRLAVLHHAARSRCRSLPPKPGGAPGASCRRRSIGPWPRSPRPAFGAPATSRASNRDPQSTGICRSRSTRDPPGSPRGWCLPPPSSDTRGPGWCGSSGRRP